MHLILRRNGIQRFVYARLGFEKQNFKIQIQMKKETKKQNSTETQIGYDTLLGVEKITEINYDVLSDNREVVKMLKQKMELEKKILALDEFALVLLELQILAIE